MGDPETNQTEKENVVCEAHAAEGAVKMSDPMAQLADQIPLAPQACIVDSRI